MKKYFKTLAWPHYAVLAALTMVVYLPVLRAQFLNWDDQTHVTKNPAVLSFDLGKMFTQPVQDIYIPLTSLSFAFEKDVFGLNPFVFHLDNLLLHIAVACLLMGFFVRLGASVLAAFLGGVLFALHPMHVESVAWVTERKDVLYALFYVLALRQWWQYLDARKMPDAALALAWGALSLLSKPMAVSLPLVMLFLEWWRCGDIRRVRWVPYVPFFLVSGVIGWMTYMHHARNPVGDIFVSALIWIWTLAFYIWKFFLPFIFHPLYALPTPVGLLAPAYLASLVFVGALAWLVVHVARHHLDRWLILAGGFFFLSIFFVLRFDTHDVHVVADRFMYLPCAGICIWLGVKADDLIARYGRWVQIAIVVMFLLLGARTFTYVQVWKDSVTLWSYVIAHYPQKEIAYNNRAVAYGDMGQYELAIRDNTQVLTFPSNRALAFYNRGVSFKDWAQKRSKEGRFEEAEKLWRLAREDFDAAITLDPQYARTYNHRGMVRAKLHDRAGAIEDLSKAIARDPAYAEAYNNRGNLRSEAGELDLALSDYRRVVELGNFMAQAYSNIGIIYARKGFTDLAEQSFSKAIGIDPRHGEAYMNRSIMAYQKGDVAAARRDADKARRLGISVDPEYLRSLKAK